MNDWTSGYVADVDYTYGYYDVLNPMRCQLGLMNAGICSPKIETACELGFGQGISVNVHAAASEIEWFGTDFNPSQAAFAQDLAGICDNKAKLYDQSFEEFCNRTDLPDFDYISLHGIWSWISDANRGTLVEFLRRKLKAGGLVYIGYNTLPGWASFAPLRSLMVQHAETIGSKGQGISSRIDNSIGFAKALMDTNPKYKLQNPGVENQLEKMVGRDRQYLAHEFFNRDWHPVHFSGMAQWLASAKLDYAVSADLLDYINLVNFTEQQQALINGIPDKVLRESTKDFVTNKGFRRDCWVKGLRKQSGIEKNEALRKARVLLTTPMADISLKIETSQGEASLNQEIYLPILEQLANHKPQSIGELADTVMAGEGRFDLGSTVEATMVLASLGHLYPVQSEDISRRVKIKTDKLNEHLINRARSSGDILYLSSPVIGGGFPVTRINQLFLSRVMQGENTASILAKNTCEHLMSQGERMLKDGKTMETKEENLEELAIQAEEFVTKRLPILNALGM